VSRAQFETELEAYKRLAEGIGEVRLAIAGTRPFMNISRPDDTREDNLKDLNERLNLLVEAHNKAVKLVEHLNPFYPQDIYLKLGECLTATRGEIMDIETGGDETSHLVGTSKARSGEMNSSLPTMRLRRRSGNEYPLWRLSRVLNAKIERCLALICRSPSRRVWLLSMQP
jgi:hypothetical protein